LSYFNAIEILEIALKTCCVERCQR